MRVSTTSPPSAVAVLDGAVAWTLERLQAARAQPLSQPTPCGEWDLGRLLAHLNEALVAIGEAAELGRITLDQPGRGDGEQLVDRIIERACRARAAWLRRLTSAPVGVGDLTLGRDTVVLVGALEIVVHGWDVSQATGECRTIPAELAVRLYGVATAVVTPDERGRRFGPVVPVPADAPVATRLLAHLGRGGG